MGIHYDFTILVATPVEVRPGKAARQFIPVRHQAAELRRDEIMSVPVYHSVHPSVVPIDGDHGLAILLEVPCVCKLVRNYQRTAFVDVSVFHPIFLFVRPRHGRPALRERAHTLKLRLYGPFSFAVEITVKRTPRLLVFHQSHGQTFRIGIHAQRFSYFGKLVSLRVYQYRSRVLGYDPRFPARKTGSPFVPRIIHDFTVSIRKTIFPVFTLNDCPTFVERIRTLKLRVDEPLPFTVHVPPLLTRLHRNAAHRLFIASSARRTE